jgi:putative SOS response-associated peptidase YedK
MRLERDDETMCGRFVQVASAELLAERFGVDEIRAPAHEPDYNVAPRKTVYAVRQREDRRVLSELRWGLVPSWAKDPKIGDRMINARAESLSDKPAYRRAFERRRCLIPAEGFYEWQSRGAGKRKQPVFVRRRDGEPLAIAGLWEVWSNPDDPEGELLRSCVIVSTNANRTLEPIHDRMPVLVEERDWATWLDPGTSDFEALKGLLVPAPDDLVVAYPVSTLVNKTDQNGPELVEPAGPEALVK